MKRYGRGDHIQYGSSVECRYKLWLEDSTVKPVFDYLKAPNFDRESQNFYKNCRCFMAQEEHFLSKAFKSGILFEMQIIKGGCHC